VTDLANIPQAFWSLGLTPIVRYRKPATVHDYLYWTQLCTRQQADNIFLIAMKECLVRAATRDTIYQVACAAGSASWSESAKQRGERLQKSESRLALEFRAASVLVGPLAEVEGSKASRMPRRRQRRGSIASSACNVRSRSSFVRVADFADSGIGRDAFLRGTSRVLFITRGKYARRPRCPPLIEVSPSRHARCKRRHILGRRQRLCGR
jgi:hypothetical protein